MRWKEPAHGEIRFVVKFLWFPRAIGGETRWLESVLIRHVYHVPPMFAPPQCQPCWLDEAFVDAKDAP